ncbi:hypothetical protein DICA1_F05094 [Diutina catenulata]
MGSEPGSHQETPVPVVTVPSAVNVSAPTNIPQPTIAVEPIANTSQPPSEPKQEAETASSSAETGQGSSVLAAEPIKPVSETAPAPPAVTEAPKPAGDSATSDAQPRPNTYAPSASEGNTVAVADKQEPAHAIDAPKAPEPPVEVTQRKDEGEAMDVDQPRDTPVKTTTAPQEPTSAPTAPVSAANPPEPARPEPAKPSEPEKPVEPVQSIPAPMEPRETPQSLASPATHASPAPGSQGSPVLPMGTFNESKRSESSKEPSGSPAMPQSPVKKVKTEPSVEKQVKQASPQKAKNTTSPEPRKSTAPITINTGEIKALVNELNPVRSVLGTIVYNPTTTWGTLQISQLPGLREEDFERLLEAKHNYVEKVHSNYGLTQYIPMIPPLSSAYVNFTLEIKIPRRFLERFQLELRQNKTNRDVWGGAGGVYTDDSNVLGVLAHLGLFDGELDLSEWNSRWKGLMLPNDPSTTVAPDSEGADDTFDDPMDETGANIPGDLSVELLLLPPLPAYHGYYAHGINTRTWTESTHNGLSYAVRNAKWESATTYLRDKTTFKRYQAEMAQDKRELADAAGGWVFRKKHYTAIKRKYEQINEA